MLGQGAPSSIDGQGAHEQGAHEQGAHEQGAQEQGAPEQGAPVFNTSRFKPFNAPCAAGWGMVSPREGPLPPAVSFAVPGEVATFSTSTSFPFAGFQGLPREKRHRSPGGSPASKMSRSLGDPSPIPSDSGGSTFLSPALGEPWA